jgi:hypothetical protein
MGNVSTCQKFCVALNNKKVSYTFLITSVVLFISLITLKPDFCYDKDDAGNKRDFKTMSVLTASIEIGLIAAIMLAWYYVINMPSQ